MHIETQQKIHAIARLMNIYGMMIFAGLLWNLVDGDIENMRQFIRGSVRGVVMLYLATTIWQLRKAYWWMIVGTSLGFALLGIAGVILGLVGGVIVGNKELIYIGVIIFPATILLLSIFYLSIQQDVRQQFVN